MNEVKNRLPIFANNLLSRFEDPTGLARPLWGDFSFWQRKVDAALAKAYGYFGGIFRATRGRYYKDPYFKVNYDDFGEQELYRGSYHVIYPDQPVIPQIDNYYEVHPEVDIVPRSLDLERKDNQPASKIADVTWECVELCRRRDGKDPMIYSRANLINSWLASWDDGMLNSVWWWLAQYLFAGYLEHPGPPTLPLRVNRNLVVLHQTSDHKLAPPGLVASKAVDWDRWEIGNEAEMHEWISENWGAGIPPPLPPSDGEIVPIDHLRITASALNMRTEPRVNGLDIGTLLQGSDVSITKRDNVWGKVEGWIHLGYTKPYP